MILLLALGCPEVEETGAAPKGTGLFTQGCPVAGEARARLLESAAETSWGEEALAGPGDALLVNEAAAFVIQNVDAPETYYSYGGTPIDAVAVQDCEQAGPELLEELGFVVGQLDLADFNASTLHQVRGTAIEILSDGSDGGAAVVEVAATDDRFWLVEETLARNVWNDGGRKELGPLFGLDITLRYTLDPGASALQIDVLLGGEPVTDGFLVGALVFPSDELDVHEFADGALNISGFGLDLSVPWIGMGSGEGSQAIAMPQAAMAYTEVSGVRALLDMNQAFSPLVVNGASVAPSTPLLLGVGAGDAASASAGFEPYFPEPIDGAAWGDLRGSVTSSGTAIPRADIWVYAENSAGTLEVIDHLVADATGRFSGRVLDLGTGWTLVATAQGRDPSEAVVATDGKDASIELGGAGKLDVNLVDEEGRSLPVRLELEREDGAIEVRYPLPGEKIDVPPGTWHVWATRGFEYSIGETWVTIAADSTATLTGTLEHVLDTNGWASVDTHVHAEASADSQTLGADRFRTAAASGLDVVISTDHEAILDLAPALDASGLRDFVSYGLGSEVTATLPEHTNAWPFPIDDSDARGAPVRWYELGFPGIYAAERERGARVIQLNHSRVNGECGILCVLDWDRGAADPMTDDPLALAMPEDTTVWSWDFDTFEVMNSNRSPLLDPTDPRHTGALVDWFAFLNLGHRVTGVAVTDVHGLDIPGQPRVYVKVPDDAPGVVTADDVADGELDGAAVMSSGAFARVDVGGAGPGDLATALGGEATLSLAVQALPEIDVTTMYVLVNCDLVTTVLATDPGGLVKVDVALALELLEDAYIVVLGFGAAPMPRGFEAYDAANVPRFITNPIYVDADGDGQWTAPGAKSCSTGVEVGSR
ncbi:hypothetical protein LBMAG42_50630 [Deltaproteobacteria bacterium]|nr:hypothetical protein LBMAG42_50630 [Deltaproteobacteria bacterium]